MLGLDKIFNGISCQTVPLLEFDTKMRVYGLNSTSMASSRRYRISINVKYFYIKQSTYKFISIGKIHFFMPKEWSFEPDLDR